MHLPAGFTATDEESLAIIASHPLAQLVVTGPDGLVATPVPLIIRGATLIGHLARPNPAWRYQGSALALFSGPDAYVSPSWYPTKVETAKVVPTWNYETIQVRGRLVAHDDPEWKREVVTQLTDHFERGRASPWQVTDAPSDYVDTMLRGIVGIELISLEVVGKRKLSQNRTEADSAAVLAGFSQGTVGEQAVAKAMRQTNT